MHRTTLVHAAVRLAKLLMVGMPAFQLWHRLRKNRQRRNSAMTSRWAFDAFALDKARNKRQQLLPQLKHARPLFSDGRRKLREHGQPIGLTGRWTHREKGETPARSGSCIKCIGSVPLALLV